MPESGLRPLVLVTLLAAGCVRVTVGRLAFVAMDGGDPAASRDGGRWWILGVPLGLPSIDTAMSAAMASRGARLLRDVAVSSDHSFYFFFGPHRYTVSGEGFR